MVPCCGSYMAYMAYRSHQHHQPRGQECAEAFHAFDDSRKDGVVIIFVQVVCDGKEHVRTNRINRARCQHGQHSIIDQYFESIPLNVVFNITLGTLGHIQPPFKQF